MKARNRKKGTLMAVMGVASVLCVAGATTLASFGGNAFEEVRADTDGTYEVDVDFKLDADLRLSDFDSYYWDRDGNNPIYCREHNPYGNGWYQAKLDHSEVWAFTDRGLVSKTNMAQSIGHLNENIEVGAWYDCWASLLTKQKYTYFSAETTVSFSPAKANAGGTLFPAFAGIQFSGSGGDEPEQAAVFLQGIAVYIDASSGALIYRNDGNAHVPEKTDAYDPADYNGAAFDRLAEHKLKLEVTETGFKAYVNDVLRLDIANEALTASPIREARMGLVGVAADCYFKNFSVTPAGGTEKSYQFVVGNAYDNFNAYFYNWACGYGANDWDQVQMPQSRLWGLTQKGLSRLTAADKLAMIGSVWLDENNLNSLLYTGQNFRYFEAETTISFDTLARTGKAGLQFGAQELVQPVYRTKGMAAFLDSSDGSVTLRSHLGNDANGEIRATDAYDAADYNGAAFDKTSKFKLSVVTDAANVKVYVNDVLRIDYALDTVAGYELGVGPVGLYGDTGTSFFENLKINPTDGSVKPVGISVDAIENAVAGKTYRLTATVSPEQASQEVLYEIKSGNAVVFGRDITFLSEGEVVLEARSAVLNSVVGSRTFTVSADPDAMYYDLSDAGDVAKLIPYFKNDNSLSTVSGVAEALSKHWTVGENGITRIKAQGDNPLVDGNYAMLYLPGYYTDYEVTFTVNDNNIALGFAGVMFGKDTYGSSQFSNGNGVNVPIQWSGYSCQGEDVGDANPNPDPDNNRPATEWGGYPKYVRNGLNLIRVRVYGRTFELYFNDMNEAVVELQMENKAEGFIALYASLQENASGATLNNLSLKMLDEQGAPVDYEKATEITWGASQKTEFARNDATRLNATVDGTQTFVNYKSDNDSVVQIVNGNIARFIGVGTANITAYHADGVAEKSKTFTVIEKVIDGSLFYDLSKNDTLDLLDFWWQEGEEADGPALPDDAFDSHWKVESGVLSSIGNRKDTVVSNEWAKFYFDRKFKNFEVNFRLKFGFDLPGWVGVMFGQTGKSASFFGDGDAAYLSVQDATAQFWGTTIGNWNDDGNYAIASSYDPYGWNNVRLKVFGGVGGRTVEFYVNDMDIPVVSKTQGVGMSEGNVALFTTVSDASFSDLHVRYLTETGEVIPYIGLEKIEITNRETSAVVGSSLTLEVELTPDNATVNDLIVTSSDRTIAVVNGMNVSFVNPGTVTITVTAKDDPALTDSITITCNYSIAGVTINNKITEAKVGDTHTLSVSDNPGSAGNYGMNYTSSDEAVATVDEYGKVTFLKAGTVVITATSKIDESKSDTMTVTVSAQSATGCAGCNSSVNGIVAFELCLVVILPVCAIVLFAKRRSRK